MRGRDWGGAWEGATRKGDTAGGQDEHPLLGVVDHQGYLSWAPSSEHSAACAAVKLAGTGCVLRLATCHSAFARLCLRAVECGACTLSRAQRAVRSRNVTGDDHGVSGRPDRPGRPGWEFNIPAARGGSRAERQLHTTHRYVDRNARATLALVRVFWVSG